MREPTATLAHSPRNRISLAAVSIARTAVLTVACGLATMGCSDDPARQRAPNGRSADASSSATDGARGPDWKRTRDPKLKPLPVSSTDRFRARSAFAQRFNRALADFRREWNANAISAVIVESRSGRNERLDPAPRQGVLDYRLDTPGLIEMIRRRAESLGTRGVPDLAAVRARMELEILRLRRTAGQLFALGAGPAAREFLSIDHSVELRRVRALDAVLERARIAIAAMRDARVASAGRRAGATTSPRTSPSRAMAPPGGARPVSFEAPLPLTPILASRIAELHWETLFVREGAGFRQAENFTALTRDEANALRDRRRQVTLNLDGVPSRLNAAFSRSRNAERARSEILAEFDSVERAVIEQRKALARLAQNLRDDRIEGERVRLEQTLEWFATRKLPDLVQAWRPISR